MRSSIHTAHGEAGIGLGAPRFSGRVRSAFRRGFLVSAVVGAVYALAACSSDSGGCKKDTDCADGRICGTDGRCEDASSGSSSGSGVSSGTGSSSGPAVGGQACTTYLQQEPECTSPCGCGSTCIYPSDFPPFCGIPCNNDQQCIDAWKSVGGSGPRVPYCHLGTADWCIF
jgi:hypothetical protein